MPLTKYGVYRVMDNVYKEIQVLREETGKVYAPNEMRPFQNFEEDAQELEITKEEALLNRAYKHVVAIKMYVKASPEVRVGMDQREPIKKRINDLILYLLELRAMHEQDNLDGISAESTQEAVKEGLMILGGQARSISDPRADGTGS